MPNIFAAADALSSAAVSSVYGEELRFLPMVRGKYTTAGSPDPDRESVTFVGTLSGELGSMNMSGDRASNFTGSVRTRDRTITVEPAAWPANARQGDHIQALDQPGQPVMEIAGEPVGDGSGNRIIVPS